MLVQRSLDRCPNAIRIPKDFVRPKAQDAPPLALDECSTARIGFGLTGMMLAIDFDDESPRSADEIREVWTDRVLATEFDAGQPLGTDQFPTDSFGFAAIAT